MIVDRDTRRSTKQFSAARDGTPAVSARGIVYRYGNTTAVAGVDLEIAAGEVYGVLGLSGKE